MAKIITCQSETITPTINQSDVKLFFAERASRIGHISYKQAVIYQDKNPLLAEARDRAEKTLLVPKLSLTTTDKFLDIGCGTGRWAEVVIPEVGHYHGTDLVQGLLDEARARNPGDNASFSCIPCTEISLEALGESLPFNKIVCLGVLMYLNDPDIPKVLRKVTQVAADECVFLLREPIGVDNRLTIKEHFSEDMQQVYNAIYRTEDELVGMCMNILGPAGFNLAECADVFTDPSYNNRVETKQKYFLFKRG